MFKKKGTGVRRQPAKVLDYCGAFRSTADVDLPSEYVLPQNLIPDVRDQGSVNSCVGFAITNIMQILDQIETGKRHRFSAGYVYGRCRDDDDDYEGMHINSALDYLIKTGACFEEHFIFNEEMPEVRKHVMSFMPLLDKMAQPYHIAAYEVYASAVKEKKYNDVKTALYTYKVPILADMDFPGGSHAVCIIGWNDKKQTFKICNSWGTEWKDKGIGDVPYSKLDRGYLLMDAKNSNDIMPFIDVPKDAWYYDAVKHCYNAGFMNGTGPDTFEPNATLTRAELAQALVNFAKKIDETGK